ncbi:MAG TPA: hypothetical protein VF731_05600, partial [Solirubrobacterales bacterium]
MNFPWGIAADQGREGHIYVADRHNARIDEFTAWGQFVLAWGWGVNKEDPKAELQSCTEASECQKGVEGSGAGQFKTVEAVAVDGAGDIYTIEAENHRVQKFDPEGHFLLGFGWGVRNGAAEAQTCGPDASPPSATCQAGIAGSGAGQLGLGEFEYRNKIAASPATNSVFVGEGGRIQRFGAGGAFEEEIKEGCLAGKSVRAIGSDKAGNLYAAFTGEADVRKLKASGPTGECLTPTFTAEASTDRPKAVAVDGSGNVYTLLDLNSPEPERAQEYDAAGNCLTCGSGGEGGKAGFDRSTESELFSIGATSACGVDQSLVAHFNPNNAFGEQSFFRIFGPHPNPVLCAPPLAPPTIAAQYPVAVESATAQVRAEINPHFWAGAVGETTYFVQYGTTQCIKEGGFEAPCASQQPAAAAKLQAEAVNEAVKSGLVELGGLTPGTEYSFRFVAQSSGGGPVFGAERRFVTYRVAAGESCPNEAFRSGPSSLLPDCRAYEMVSPLDKEG